MSSDIFKKTGVFFYDLASNNASRDSILDWMETAQFSWACLQCFNGSTLIEQSNIAAWRDAIRANNMRFGLWGVLHTDPSGDASRADSQIGLWGADFFIANAEDDYKTDTGGVRGRSATFCTAFRAAQPHIEAALVMIGATGSEVAIFGDVTDVNAGVFDFKSWYDNGFHVIPEAYASNSLYEPDRCVRQYRRCRWPLDKIHPTCGIFVGGSSVSGASYRTKLAASNNTEYETEVRTDTPTALWKMQEGSGTAVDMISGADLDAAVGTPDYLQAGPIGGHTSIRLVGGETLKRNGGLNVTNNFTLEMLVHVQAIGANSQKLFYNGNSGGDGWGILVNLDRTLQYLCGGVAFGTISHGAAPDAFAHICLIRRSGTWEYWINGFNDTPSAGGDAPLTPTTERGIGDSSVQAAFAYVAIYSTALSSARIQAHYAEFTRNYPVCSPDTAYGYSLFLGDITGALGATQQQDFFDLGLAGSADHAAWCTPVGPDFYTSYDPRTAVGITAASGRRLQT